MSQLRFRSTVARLWACGAPGVPAARMAWVPTLGPRRLCARSVRTAHRFVQDVSCVISNHTAMRQPRTLARGCFSRKRVGCGERKVVRAEIGRRHAHRTHTIGCHAPAAALCTRCGHTTPACVEGDVQWRTRRSACPRTTNKAERAGLKLADQLETMQEPSKWLEQDGVVENRRRRQVRRTSRQRRCWRWRGRQARWQAWRRRWWPS